MSRSNKSKQTWDIPYWFKRMQCRKIKMRLKKNTRQILADPEQVAALRPRKSHRWDYF